MSEYETHLLNVATEALKDGDYNSAFLIFNFGSDTVKEGRCWEFREQFGKSVEKYFSSNPKNIEKVINFLPQFYRHFLYDHAISYMVLQEIQRRNMPSLGPDALKICRKVLEYPSPLTIKSKFRMLLCKFSDLAFSHREMRRINDEDRNSKFAQAISKSIKAPSDVVVSIGSGTGLLSVIASRYSKTVICLENETQCKIASQIIRQSEFPKRIHLQSSKDYYGFSKADVIVIEILDCCLVENRLIISLINIHIRFAKPSTIFLPSRATVIIRLFKSQSIFNQHAVSYNGKRYRSTYVRLKEKPGPTHWHCQVGNHDDFEILSEPVEILNIDFSNLEELRKCIYLQDSAQLISNTCSQAHGIVVHFRSDLDPDGEIVIDSSLPGGSWDMGIYPFKEAINIRKNQIINVNWKLENSKLDIWPIYPEENPNIVYHIYEMTYFFDEKLSKGLFQQIPDQHYDRVLIAIPSILFRTFMERYVNNNKENEKEPPEETDENYEEMTHVAITFHYWDGSYNSKMFNVLQECIAFRLPKIKEIIPKNVKIIGRLFKSDRIDWESRPKASAFCGVQIDGIMKGYGLSEYRDIRLNERSDIVICSEDFEIVNFELTIQNLRDHVYKNWWKIIEIDVFRNQSVVDGVLYNFDYSGVPNSTMSSFLFEERVENKENIRVIIDMHEYQLSMGEKKPMRTC